MGRQAANTKLGAKRIHEVRTRGGNRKFRAMRLDSGSFSWGSEAVSRKARIVTVVYNASNNELVRTGTLVKNAVVQIDATPFRQWYEAHYATPIGARKGKGAKVIRLALLPTLASPAFFFFFRGTEPSNCQQTRIDRCTGYMENPSLSDHKTESLWICFFMDWKQLTRGEDTLIRCVMDRKG